jgi:galactose mutarotase-like enzyme
MMAGDDADAAAALPAKTSTSDDSATIPSRRGCATTTNSTNTTITEVGSVAVIDPDGTSKTLRVFRLQLGGVAIEVTNLGAALLTMRVHGDDWIVGYDSVVDMWTSQNPYYFSIIAGRVANRIRHGQLRLDQNDGGVVMHQLATNDPPHHLHGGTVGFGRQIWEAEIVGEERTVHGDPSLSAPAVRFTLLSPDGDQGYPGTVQVTVEYRLHTTPKANVVNLSVAMRAKLVVDHDQNGVNNVATPVNLTQHAYFNLSGSRPRPPPTTAAAGAANDSVVTSKDDDNDDDRGILSHTLRINADAYTPVDNTGLPTRHVQSLDDDPVMDFRTGHRTMKQALTEYGRYKYGRTVAEVERDLRQRGRHDVTATADDHHQDGLATPPPPYGFDHNYVVAPLSRGSDDAYANVLKYVATLQCDKKRLSVCSTAPGVQLYTGNYLDGGGGSAADDTAAARHHHRRWQGLCLETQHFPDSVLVDPTLHPEFFRGKCPILTPDAPEYRQDVEYTMEWAADNDDAVAMDDDDDFYGTAVVGEDQYNTVEELWRDQGVGIATDDNGNDDVGATEWYRRGATYYDESCPPTIDGVLGGFAAITDVDLDGSLDFIHRLVQVRPETRVWLVAPAAAAAEATRRGGCRACECGAGLGRVVRGLLLSPSALPGITHCDLVEPSETLLLAAPAYLGDPVASKCRYFKSALQDWYPTSQTYSLMWVQWVLMYLTDRDIIAFLQRCGRALLPGGFVLIKENICESSDIELDEEDASVTRSRRYWEYLIHRAGLEIVYAHEQRGLPSELHPVVMMALEPSRAGS